MASFLLSIDRSLYRKQALCLPLSLLPYLLSSSTCYHPSLPFKCMKNGDFSLLSVLYYVFISFCVRSRPHLIKLCKKMKYPFYDDYEKLFIRTSLFIMLCFCLLFYCLSVGQKGYQFFYVYNKI